MFRIEFLHPDDLERSQIDWVRTYHKFKHPDDKTFFGVHLVPIEKEGLDYFIDLSSDSLRVILIDFFMEMGWFEIEYFKSPGKFIKLLNSNEMIINKTLTLNIEKKNDLIITFAEEWEKENNLKHLE